MIAGPGHRSIPRDLSNLRGRGLLAAVSAALAVAAFAVAPSVPPAQVAGDPQALVVGAPPAQVAGDPQALVVGDAIAAGARCMASPAPVGVVAVTYSERTAECLPMARHGAP